MDDFFDGLWALIKLMIIGFLIIAALVIIWSFVDYVGSFSGFIDWFKDTDGDNNVGPSLFVLAIAFWIIARFVFGFTGLVEVDYSGVGNFALRNILAPVVVGLILWMITGDTSITFISVPVIGVISLSLGL